MSEKEKLPSFAKKNNKKKVIVIKSTLKLKLCTISDNFFVGEDDIIERKIKRSYSCTCTELTEAYVLT